MSLVYLAARYPRRDEMRAISKILAACGVTVVSRWLLETDDLESDLPTYSPEHYSPHASVDLEDIQRADTLIFFSEDPLQGFKRGGRHVEFGYALALGKRVIVIGGHENVFHFLPGVIHYPTLQSFLEEETTCQ